MARNSCPGLDRSGADLDRTGPELDRSGAAVWWRQSLIWTLGATPLECLTSGIGPCAAAGVLLELVSLVLRDIRLSCPFVDWGSSAVEEYPAMTANEEAEFLGLTGSVLAMTAVETSPQVAVHS